MSNLMTGISELHKSFTHFFLITQALYILTKN